MLFGLSRAYALPRHMHVPTHSSPDIDIAIYSNTKFAPNGPPTQTYNHTDKPVFSNNTWKMGNDNLKVYVNENSV
jgi:hypothetical protein